MNELQLVLPGKLQRVEELPEKYKPYSLRTADTAILHTALGIVMLNRVEGNGFCCWVIHCFIEQTGTLRREMEAAALELMLPFANTYHSPALPGGKLKENQFNLFYKTEPVEEFLVEAGQTYSFLCVHFERSFLEPLAVGSPLLSAFLDAASGHQAATLLSQTQYLDPQMITIVNQLLQHDYEGALAPHFFTLKIQEFLLALLKRAGATPINIAFTEEDLQKGEMAKDIIMKDFETFPTIKQLARQIGTNEHKLKMVFKHLYGTTIFDYSRKARLDYARQLLLQTDWTLQHIALAVGYPEASNFSIAFKQLYGYAPGYLKKKRC